jgi:hypothetical protein
VRRLQANVIQAKERVLRVEGLHHAPIPERVGRERGLGSVGTSILFRNPHDVEDTNSAIDPPDSKHADRLVGRVVSRETANDGSRTDRREGGSGIRERREEAWSSRNRSRFKCIIPFNGWCLFPKRDHIDLATLRAADKESTRQRTERMDGSRKLELQLQLRGFTNRIVPTVELGVSLEGVGWDDRKMATVDSAERAT